MTPLGLPTAMGVARVLEARETLEGEGMLVRRAIPNEGLPRLDPFLLLDHMGPHDHGPGEAKGAPDHPHRGFETVTYILEGAFEHKDSQGNKGELGPGWVQWMTAGDGVVHSELPSEEIRREGGRMHGLQLWVNLPRKDKRMRPRYQDIPADRIPEVPVKGGKVRIIAGRFQDQEAVIDTRTPITYLHASLEPGGQVRLPVPEGHQGFVYVVRGAGEVDGASVQEARLGVLEPGDVEVRAGPEGLDLLLVTGRPLHEPVVQWGPFVMNERKEILEAIEDFQSGRMGSIPAEMDQGAEAGSEAGKATA